MIFLLHSHSASNPSESAGSGRQGSQHWALIRIAIHYNGENFDGTYNFCGTVIFLLHSLSASNPSECAGSGHQGSQHWTLIRILPYIIMARILTAPTTFVVQLGSVIFLLHSLSASNPSECAGSGHQGSQHSTQTEENCSTLSLPRTSCSSRGN